VGGAHAVGRLKASRYALKNQPTFNRRDRYIDDLMKRATDVEDPNHRLYVGFEAFKARRHAKLTCVISDHTYGAMQIYSVAPSASLP